MDNRLLDPVLETPRLLLRHFIASDEKRLIQYLMDAEFMAYAPSGALTAPAANLRFLELKGSLAASGFGKLAVVLKSNRQLIGYCGVEYCILNGRQELELGYRLIKAERGFGYATEAARALLDYYNKKGVNNIMAFTEPQNAASINVLKKLDYIAVGSSVYQGMPIMLFRR